MPNSSQKNDGLTEQEVGSDRADDMRLTEAAPEAAVTREDVALGVQVGADRPPGSTETPSAGEPALCSGSPWILLLPEILRS